MRSTELSTLRCGSCGAPVSESPCSYCGVTNDMAERVGVPASRVKFELPSVPEGMSLDYKVLLDQRKEKGRFMSSMSIAGKEGVPGLTLLFVEDEDTGKPYNLNMRLDQLAEWDLVSAGGSSLNQEVERALANKPNYKVWEDGLERITDEENSHFGRISINQNFKDSFFNQFADMCDSVQIPWQEGLSIVKRSVETETDSKDNSNWLLKGFILSVMGATVLQGESVGIPEGARLITGLALFLWLISKVADLQPELDSETKDFEGSTKENSENNFGRAVISRDADGGFNISRRGTMGNLKAAKRAIVKDGKRGKHF